MVFMGGRQSGKSYWAYKASMQINNMKYMKLDSSKVDSEQWYSVLADNTVAEWLRTQDKSLVVETRGSAINGTTTFDMHEKIYLLMVLKFQ